MLLTQTDDVLMDEKHLDIVETSAEIRRRNLHQIMDRYNLSPQNIADILGVTRATVWVWTSRSGERDIPEKRLALLKYRIRTLICREYPDA